MINNQKEIGTALLSYGLSGSVFHAPLLAHHSGFFLNKIWVRSGKRHPERKYPDLTVVEALEDILKDKAIELVVVNTPEHTHYQYAKKALTAGKNVVVEKAFTVSSKEAEELITLAKQKGLCLSVFHNSRWHGDYMTIEAIIRQKLLGKLVEYEAHFDRYRNYVQADSWKEEPQPGTGSLYNLGPHLIDQALNLFGWPKRLWADIGIQRPGGKVCDQFALVLFYDQLKVTLKSSYLVREPGPRYALYGTNGSFLKFGADTQEALLKSGKSPLDEDFGTEAPAYWGTLNTEIEGLHFTGTIETQKGSYMGYYDNIYEVIRNKGALMVQPQHALRTIQIIEAATTSNEEKRAVIL